MSPLLLQILFVAVVGLAVLGASLALPLKAARRWRGNWRLLALLPYFALAVLLYHYAVALPPQAESHSLAPLPLLLWSPATLVYLGILWLARLGGQAQGHRLPQPVAPTAPIAASA